MVLGAGMGSRLKPFTVRRPKPLIPILGVPCIEFSLTHLAEAGVKDVVVNTHAHAEQLRHYLQSQPVPHLNLVESKEADQLLGSAGGFRKALPFFQKGPFLSMNADVIHFADLQTLSHAHAKFKRDHGVFMTLMLASGEVVEKQSGAYSEILKNGESGLIEGVGAKKTHTPFYTGTAVFEHEAFSHLRFGRPAEFVPEVLLPMIQAKKVAFIESSALWIDIGSPELWAQAHLTLDLALQSHTLSPRISLLLKQADPTCRGEFELGKNTIRLEDIEYEIKGFRNS